MIAGALADRLFLVNPVALHEAPDRPQTQRGRPVPVSIRSPRRLPRSASF